MHDGRSGLRIDDDPGLKFSVCGSIDAWCSSLAWPGGGGKGCTLIFSGSGHFLEFNILNFNIFGGFQKK